MHVKTLILGAGLTGLSTAYHLERQGQTDYLLLEQAAAPGGLCASRTVRGFTLDCGGHLLHLHTPYGKKLVRTLLKGNLLRRTRRAFIYTGTSRVPFPFQAHLYALPEKARQACVQGLLETARQTPKTPKTFKQWCLQSFGRGVYDQFMRPYNTKLWGLPPEELTCDWCGPFVPRPTPPKILHSAQRPPRQSYGYNASFFYPRQGGCGALAEALASGVTRLQTRTRVTRVDLKTKTVRAGGKTFSYDTLVNTLPLPAFLRLLTGEERLTALAEPLHNRPVLVYHLAINRAVKPFSWIYFPDETDPFYRVGLQSGFSPANAPKGTSLFYIELPPNAPKSKRRIWNALVQKGIIRKDDEALLSCWQPLPYAYAVYDKHRSRAVCQALEALAKRGCFCAGRYGKWEYSFMESSLLEGKALAEKLV